MVSEAVSASGPAKADGRRWALWLLVPLFGASSWAGVNAFWLQLPLMGSVAAEGWELPSWLAVLVQLGNVGPLLLGLLKAASPRQAHRLAPGLIAALIALSALSTTLLAFLWETRGRVGGAERSVALLPLAWLVSLAAASSNVLCLPFVGRFTSARPLNLYFLGMSLSGLLPSLLALVQGAGSVRCLPSANGTSVAESSPPLFPPRTFYLLVALLVLFSLAAFVVLWRWPYAKSQRDDAFPEPQKAAVEEQASASDDSDASSARLASEVPSDGLVESPLACSRCEAAGLLVVTAWACALKNVVLPSVEAYATRGYGARSFHETVVGTGLAGPLGSVLAFRLVPQRLAVFALLTAALSLASGVFVAQAALSPHPPFAQTSWASGATVALWSLAFCGFSFVQATAGVRLRRGGGQRLLFWCGVATQAGSAAGAAVVFPLVSRAPSVKEFSRVVSLHKLFVSAPLCP